MVTKFVIFCIPFAPEAANSENAEKGVKIKGTKAADYDNPEAYGIVLTCK